MKKIIKFLVIAIFGFFISHIMLSGIKIDWKSFLISHTLKVDSKVQLYIHINSRLSDFPESNSFSFGRALRPCLWDIDQGLRTAAEDPRITSVLLHVESMKLTEAQVYTIGEAIKYFRSKGKIVKCYSPSFCSDNGGFPSYLLATYCNEIALQRFGQVKVESLNYLNTTDKHCSNIQERESEHLPMQRKNAQQVNATIRKQRDLALPLPVDGRAYIDTQALNMGLINSIVSRITKEDNTIVVQDYIRVIQNTQAKKINVVAVIPIPEANIDDAFDIAHKRSDVQSIVISVNSAAALNQVIQKIGSIPKNIRSKPIVVYVRDLDGGRSISYPSSLNDNVQLVRMLNNAIEVAIKRVGLDALKVRSEVIQTGTLASNFIKDLVGVGRSMRAIFHRSLDHVIKMSYTSE